MMQRGGEESCGSAGCTSRRAKCGCQLESNTMNIINEFKQLYEDKMRLIDEEGGSGDCTVQAKLNLQQDWIRDLTEQNEMLVRSVEELELEATERVLALEKKLKQTSKRANEVMNGYKDYSFDLEEKFRETERLRSDLTNLLTLLKTDCNGNKVNFDDYRFYTMDEDVVDQLRTRIESNYHGMHANKALVDLREKEEEIRDLEAKIKELKSAPTVVTTEYAELKQSMLDMRDALTAEVADKHDAIVALKRDVQMLEEQCRKADQQTHFKDDIIKELRKEIKQLRLEKQTQVCWACPRNTVELIAGLEAKCQNLLSKFENRTRVCICPPSSSTITTFKAFEICHSVVEEDQSCDCKDLETIYEEPSSGYKNFCKTKSIQAIEDDINRFADRPKQVTWPPSPSVHPKVEQPRTITLKQQPLRTLYDNSKEVNVKPFSTIGKSESQKENVKPMKPSDIPLTTLYDKPSAKYGRDDLDRGTGMKEITWPQNDRYSRPQENKSPGDSQKPQERSKPLDENRSAYSGSSKSYKEDTQPGLKQITWPEENYDAMREVPTKINKQESQYSQPKRAKPIPANRSFIPVPESRRKRDAKRNRTVDLGAIEKDIVWPKRGGYNEVDSSHEINLQTHDLQGQRSELPGTVRPVETTPFSANMPKRSSLTQSGSDHTKSGLHPKFEDHTRYYEIPKRNRGFVDVLKNPNKSKQDRDKLNAQSGRPGRSRSLMNMKASDDLSTETEKRNQDKLVEPKSSLNSRDSDTSRSSYNSDGVWMRPSRSRGIMDGRSQRRMYYLNSYGEMMRMPRHMSPYRNYGPNNSRFMGSRSLMRLGYRPSWFMNRQTSFDMPPYYYSPRRNEPRGITDLVNSCVNPQDDDVDDDMMRRSRSGSLFDLNRPYNDMYYRNSFGRLRPLGYRRMYDPMRGRFYNNRVMGWNNTVDPFGRPINSLYQRSSSMHPSYFDSFGRRIHQYDSDLSCMVPRDPFRRLPRRTRSMIDFRRRPSFRRNSFGIGNNSYRRFNDSNMSPYDDVEREIIRSNRSRSMVDMNRRSFNNNIRKNSRGELINSPRYGLKNSRSGESGRSYNNRNNFMDVYKKPSNLLNRRYSYDSPSYTTPYDDYNQDSMRSRSSKSLMELNGRSSRDMQYGISSDRNRNVSKYNSNAKSSKQRTSEDVVGAPKKQNILQNAPKYNRDLLPRDELMPYTNDPGRFRRDSSEEYQDNRLKLRKSPRNSENKQSTGGFMETVKNWLPLGSQAPSTSANNRPVQEDLHESFGSMRQGTYQVPAITSKADNDSLGKRVKKITYNLPSQESVIEIIGAPRNKRRSSSKSLESKSIIFASDRNRSFENKSETRLYMKMIKKKLKKAMMDKLQSEIEEKGALITHNLIETGKIIAEVSGVDKMPGIGGVSDIVEDVRDSCYSCKKRMIKRLKSGNLCEEDVVRELSFMKRKLKKSITKKVNELIEDKAASLVKEKNRGSSYSSDYKISNESFPVMSDDAIAESVGPKVNVQHLEAKIKEIHKRPKEVNCCKVSRTNSKFKLDIDLEDFVDQVKNVMIEKAEETLEEKRLSLIRTLGLEDKDLQNIGMEELQNLLRRAGGMDSVIPLTGSDHSDCSQQQSDTKLMQDIVIGTANRAIWDTMHRERQMLVDDLVEKDKQLTDMHELVSMTMRRLVVVFDGFHQIHDYTEAIKECFEREKLMELEEENSELKEVIGKSTDNLAALEGKTEELISENCQLQECQLEYVQKIEILEAEKMELMNNCCQMQDKLERLSHTEEISIESENMIQTLRFELEDVRKKNEDCLCTIECLSGQKQEQCCKIESLEQCVKDLSKKIETRDAGVQWSRSSSPKRRTSRRRSPARSRSYDDEHEEREESVFTFGISCTGNKDKKPNKRTRSRGRHRSRSKDDDQDDDDYESSIEKSRFKTHHNIHDNSRYSEEDEERSHHANLSNVHRNYKVSKRDGHRDNRLNYSSRHGSSHDESDLEDDDKMLIVRRKTSNTSFFDDDDFSEITKSHREDLYATKPDLSKRISFSESADQQTDASSSHDDSKKIAKCVDKKRRCQTRRSEELRQDEIQVAKRVAGHLAQKLQVHMRNSRSDCGSDQALGDLKVVKLTAISTNSQPWCQLQGTVHDIKDSVSRIIVKENEVKLAHQRIAELEEQVQWISKKDEIIDIQNDTLNIVENELQAYRTMECEVEAARGCREREVCNLKQTIQTLLLNLNDEKQRSENLQRAVDLYLNSISVLESSESNLKREISEQKMTIGNLQDALVSVKQGLDEQRSRTEQEVGLGWASRWFGSAPKQQTAHTANAHKANNVHDV